MSESVPESTSQPDDKSKDMNCELNFEKIKDAGRHERV